MSDYQKGMTAGYGDGAAETEEKYKKHISHLQRQLSETEQQRDEAGRRYVEGLHELAEARKKIEELENTPKHTPDMSGGLCNCSLCKQKKRTEELEAALREIELLGIPDQEPPYLPTDYVLGRLAGYQRCAEIARRARLGEGK